MTADFKVSGNQVTMKEEDGIDYAAVTVQLPGGERVAFLFTVKQLEAKGTLDSFSGDFVVPSYRGSTFLDPKVQRAAVGWQKDLQGTRGGTRREGWGERTGLPKVHLGAGGA